MHSRKQFLKQMLYQGLRFFIDLPGPGPQIAATSRHTALQSDLPFTEISPSLLAIEAQRRGIPVENENAESLRQTILMEMIEKCPFSGANSTIPKAV
ncbi:hypothetical protein [Desulfatirhabdium butyrativorans]|uniref:hypothetical protein n=1 Tax=Desulfatirhabdium butyrativorans TaxID=340467 RepID=UPI000412439A|nr:hypothetical protein [Desulfatirhabdium butyrativorans]